jgi:hypothetical protein
MTEPEGRDLNPEEVAEVMSWARDYEGIEGLAYRLRVSKADNLALQLGSDSLVESLVHEVAHALSLGVPVECGVSILVQAALLPLDHTALVYNEGLSLASEQHTLRALGIECDREDLADEAKRQGVSEGVFDSLWGSKEALDLGQRVTRFIGRRLGRGRSLRRL